MLTTLDALSSAFEPKSRSPPAFAYFSKTLRVLSLTLNGVSLGRLWVPGGSVQSLIERYRDVVPEGFIDDPAVRRVIDMLANEQRFEPSFDLTDGRQVRLVDLVAGDGEMIIGCETTRR